MLDLDHLFDAQVTLAAPVDFGDTPAGRRRVIPITGGTFAGARMKGRILDGGADWQVLRADGTAELDTRYTLQTDDGALIYIQNWGYRHGPAEVIARLAKGDVVDPKLYYFRTVPTFETSAVNYAWLNSTICVGTGIRHPDSVELQVYEVK
ncbi:MAG: hypothetical protein K0Q70_2852 [Rhodospirillales bacterium]|nr:hypothetical protein [Rhodospirillales bacterium]